MDEFQPSSSGIRKQLVAALRICMQDLKGRLRLGILLSPGAEVMTLDRHILAIPFHAFSGIKAILARLGIRGSASSIKGREAGDRGGDGLKVQRGIGGDGAGKGTEHLDEQSPWAYIVFRMSRGRKRQRSGK